LPNTFTSSASGIIVNSGSDAPAGNNGGSITVNANQITISGPLTASGQNLSNGGQITLNGSLLGMSLTGPTNADGGTGGNAAGGNITLQLELLHPPEFRKLEFCQRKVMVRVQVEQSPSIAMPSF